MIHEYKRKLLLATILLDNIEFIVNNGPTVVKNGWLTSNFWNGELLMITVGDVSMMFILVNNG